MDRVNKNLVEMTTCTICQEMYQRPRQLPCQHVYCSKCLHKMISNAQDIYQPELECPLCRHRVLIPANDVNGFPMSLVIVNLCDTVLQLSKEPTDSPDSLSEETHSSEQLKEALKGYVDKFKSSKQELGNTKVSFNDKCDQVEKAVKERAVLLHSAVDNYTQHIVNKVREIRGEVNFKLDSEFTRVALEEQQAVDSVQMLEDNKHASGGLLERTKSLMSALSTTITVSVPKLNVHFPQEPEKISKIFGHISSSDRNFADDIGSVETACVGAAGGTHVYAEKVKVSNKLSDSRTDPFAAQSNNENARSLTESGSNRRVSELKIPYNPQSLTVTDEGDLVTLTSTSNVDIWSNGFQVSVKVPNAGQICFHQDDLIVTDSVNSGIHIRRKDCFHKHYIHVPELYPFGLCATYNGIIVISCKRSELYRFELDPENHLIKYQVLLKDSIIRFPEYVATNQKILVITCSCTNTVVGTDMNGRLKFVYGSSQGSNDGQLNNPKGVCVADDGSIYVADSRNHRVVTLSSSGELLGYFLTSADSVYYPQLLTLHSNKLYVSHTDEVYKSWTVTAFQLPVTG